MAIPDVKHRYVYYPESDGEPMAETDTHRDLMTDLILALSDHFQNDQDVYVSGNLLLYYKEGDSRKSISPDVFVVKGIEKKRRPIYKLWEEGKAPDMVIELTSENTRLEDLGTKKGLYAAIGVKEYFIFDPFSEYLQPNLRGYKLMGDEYVAIQGNRFVSETTGLELKIEDGSLRLFELFSGKRLPTPVETAQAKKEAERKAEDEQKARIEAEKKAQDEQKARIEAEKKAQDEQKARIEAEEKAQDEQKARIEAEEEIRKLKAELERERQRKNMGGK